MLVWYESYCEGSLFRFRKSNCFLIHVIRGSQRWVHGIDSQPSQNIGPGSSSCTPTEFSHSQARIYGGININEGRSLLFFLTPYSDGLFNTKAGLILARTTVNIGRLFIRHRRQPRKFCIFPFRYLCNWVENRNWPNYKPLHFIPPIRTIKYANFKLPYLNGYLNEADTILGQFMGYAASRQIRRRRGIEERYAEMTTTDSAYYPYATIFREKCKIYLGMCLTQPFA